MISDPKLVFYACISKGTTILAEFNSVDPDLQTLALKCLEKAPALHSMFSHTVRKRTYTFLLDEPDPYIYFAIFDEKMERYETLWFLNRVKEAFKGMIRNDPIKNFDDLSSLCFQGEFNPVFRQLLSHPVEPEQLNLDLNSSLPQNVLKDKRNLSLDCSTRGKRIVSLPLLGKPGKGLKKKKRLSGEVNGDTRDHLMENKVVDVSDDGGSQTRDFPASMQKNGGYLGDMGAGRQKAKQVWKQQVWMVLILDLCVCSVLFGVWLWICRGFRCVDG